MAVVMGCSFCGEGTYSMPCTFDYTLEGGWPVWAGCSNPDCPSNKKEDEDD